ncbi:hypothetical protein K474DRAFT_477737 [Panus rudis PR-1116 ss-1]|nr:hypothetical protein K474DRAFT_477737 [Panus rudis PR-1116 ss-1]
MYSKASFVTLFALVATSSTVVARPAAVLYTRDNAASELLARANFPSLPEKRELFAQLGDVEIKREVPEKRELFAQLGDVEIKREIPEKRYLVAQLGDVETKRDDLERRELVAQLGELETKKRELIAQLGDLEVKREDQHHKRYTSSFVEHHLQELAKANKPKVTEETRELHARDFTGYDPSTTPISSFPGVGREPVLAAHRNSRRDLGSDARNQAIDLYQFNLPKPAPGGPVVLKREPFYGFDDLD